MDKEILNKLLEFIDNSNGTKTDCNSILFNFPNCLISFTVSNVSVEYAFTSFKDCDDSFYGIYYPKTLYNPNCSDDTYLKILELFRNNVVDIRSDDDKLNLVDEVLEKYHVG